MPARSKGSTKTPRKRPAKAAAEPLSHYEAKRDFARTDEPRGGRGPADRDPLFVVQMHAATRLHYDLRLQVGDVLRSWAVTRGPSLDPKVRRLAVRTEDHPLDYYGFEGVIPKGEYGGGTMMVWDRGTWAPMGDAVADLAKGHIKFRLDGHKLKGGWALVRLKNDREGNDNNWLLIKERDTYVRPEAEGDILADEPLSALSGRTLEEIAGQAPAKSKRRRRRPVPGKLVGAKPAALPATPPRPQLASPVDAPPAADAWLHEIKLDGYRTLCRLDDGRARLFTRNGHDWTERYAPIAAAFEGLRAKSAVIDGEICVQDGRGLTSLGTLQDALGSGAMEKLTFFAFDLLYLDGHDLAGVALTARKAALAALIDDIVDDTAPVQFSDHVRGGGPAFFEQARRLSLEGVISKRADAHYTPGRSKSWLKAKCVAAADFAIVGYAESEAAGGLAALLLADTGSDGLRYVGKVGTGWSAPQARALTEALDEHRRKTPPLVVPKGVGGKDTVWVKPKLLAEVEYAARTRDDMLRHAVYKGMRPDKAPAGGAAAASRKRHVTDADLANIWITNPDRVMFGAGGPTKLDLAVYYARVGDWMIPEVAARPLTLIRCPSGALGDTFYQRHAMPGMPAEIKRIALREDGSRERTDYLYVADAKGLLALAQFGVVEFHPWGCRVDKPERPDRMIFDLDPDERLDWREVVDAAYELRDALAALGLVPFVRTTGGKGLHVVVALERRHAWPAVKGFALAFVKAMVARAPRRYTANSSKQARRGRIYIDYLRNGRGATAVGSYSLRARAGVPAATPVTWSELADIEDPLDLNLWSVPERLATLATDPWADLPQAARALTRAAERDLGIKPGRGQK